MNSDKLLVRANLEIIAYQLGLESVEARLVVHQKNKAVYEENIAVLEFEVKDKSNAITRLKNQLDETLREKDDLQAKLEQFKKDNGYHAISPPLTRNYMPPLADLSFVGLDDSVYRPTANKTSASVSQVETSTFQTSNTSVEMPKVESVRPSGVIIEYWVSNDEEIFQSNDLQATDKPSLKRIEFTNAMNESVKPKQAEKPKITTQNPKIDKRDWNGQMTQKLGLGFGFTNKACFVCGRYNHLIKDCDFHEKKMAKKSVLKNIGKNTSQREIRPVWNSVQRINHQNKFVPSAVLTRENPQQGLKNKGNNLTSGFYARGGKIIGKGKIRTDKLDFEDVFFVKELNFNLFSVSQMCDKKNSVLFTGTECLVLSLDFKLLDESQVLLRVPRQSNMYSFDLKNVVPSGDLTCLFAKAIIDESKLWHRRLGHGKSKLTKNAVRGPQEANGDTGLKKSVDARQSKEKNVSTQQYIMFLLWFSISSSYKSSDETYKNDTADDAAGETHVQKPARKAYVYAAVLTRIYFRLLLPVTATSDTCYSNDGDPLFVLCAFDDEDLDTYNSPSADQVMGAEADFNNMEHSTVVGLIPITRVHSIHPKD
ncbi:ribonuclease H-like domain-containing protein [Tanacetum coccineum]